jgi:CHAD domain-containing protein
MAYCFKPGEAVADEIRRIVRDEIDSAVNHLRAGANRDEAVHEARKSMKKIRAVLRLVRPRMRRGYRHENRVFRDIGRALSAVRDAAALVQMVDQLEQRYGAERLAPVRDAVAALKQDREKNAVIDVDRVTRRLVRARERVDSWPLDGGGFDLIAPGLKRAYQLAKKAYKQAESGGSDEQFHECRKRSKDLWYHMRLLEPAAPRSIKPRERVLDELQQALGDDHNLVVLAQSARDDPRRFGGAETVRFLTGVIDDEQQRLRRKAQALARRAYGAKPRAFLSRIQTLWDAWTSPPRKGAQKAARRSAAVQAAGG